MAGPVPPALRFRRCRPPDTATCAQLSLWSHGPQLVLVMSQPTKSDFSSRCTPV